MDIQLFNYFDWCNYLTIVRTNFIKRINRLSSLDNCPDNKIFVNIVKKVIGNNIFDITNISFLGLTFLDKYLFDYLIKLVETNTDLRFPNTDNIDIDFDDNLYNIVEFIINLIIQIEFIINMHLFLLLNILRQSGYGIFNRYGDRYNNILGEFDKISSSTGLLLVMKIFMKMNNIFMLLDDNLIMENTDFIKKHQFQMKEFEKKLDNFILGIEKYSGRNIKNINPDKNENETFHELYRTCMDYFIDLIQFNINIFNLAFDLLIKYIEIKHFGNSKNYNGNDVKEVSKFQNIKNTINNFLELELIQFKNKFF